MYRATNNTQILRNAWHEISQLLASPLEPMYETTATDLHNSVFQRQDIGIFCDSLLRTPQLTLSEND